MKTNLLVVIILWSIVKVNAQFINQKTLDFSIGYGLTSSNEPEANVIGTGLYSQGEYVMVHSKWVDFRPYAGLILTKTNMYDRENPYNYKAATKAFLFGGKTRIKAPIPWIAPYLEIGAGAYLGSFQTNNPFVAIDKKGLFFHIPFSLGLELSPKHKVSVAFTYYFHSNVGQYNGAAAFGLSIPLKTNGLKS